MTSSYDYGREWRMAQRKFGFVDPPPENILQAYLDDVNTNDRVVLRKVETGEVVPVLAAKRGNIAYSRKKKKQLAPVIEAFENMVLEQSIPGSRRQLKYAHALLVTFTYPHDMDVVEAWRGTTERINRFKAYLNKLMRGDKSDPYHDSGYVSMTIKEGTTSGYPAPHMIIIFARPIRIFRHNRKWRIQDKSVVDKLKEAWARTGGGFLDVQAIVNGKIDSENPETGEKFGRSAIRYVLKYVTKCTTSDVDLPDDVRTIADWTHAMMKYTGGRDIIGKKFKQMIGLDPSPIRLDDPLYELKLMEGRLRKLRKWYDEHCEDFGVILTPEYREMNQLEHDVRVKKLEILQNKPPPEWELITVRAFRPWERLAEQAFMEQIEYENEILRMARQHSKDLEDPEYIAAMLDGAEDL